MAIVAVLGASFSLRDNEPNPCNVRIAEELFVICLELIAQGHSPVVAVQWEIGLALQKLGKVTEGTWESLIKVGGWPYCEIGQYDDGKYLGTQEVLDEALPFFRELGATQFVGVANPFIHQPYLYWLARKHFKLKWRRVRWVGFDKQSTQWWCRSWWQFLWQCLLLASGKSHGYNGRQAKV